MAEGGRMRHVHRDYFLAVIDGRWSDWFFGVGDENSEKAAASDYNWCEEERDARALGIPAFASEHSRAGT